VKASAVHAITTKEFPTKAIRPANSRLDLSRLSQVFGVTRRELEILVQRG
jgi:dTDP-4-dehydrorhamnose reductase